MQNMSAIVDWVEDHSKEIYAYGRKGFGVSLILYGIAVLMDYIRWENDLAQYYDFWATVTNMRMTSPEEIP
jgi:hypothetical protein